ncbi:nuclear transport factor 2 family protein [Catelliglobosispora koreensis]|uniref:nuclear transport factor 2 family protein n=1 Tax=Catelliglobosispora koreensis TaxID=129052 RepID=UPI00037893FA|nr:nuclear transport factor 2 family protein [Catelliglobosispora koreensis]
MTAMRSAEEVFTHHGQALGAENLEDIVSDYADDAILVVQGKIYRGKDGARAVFTQLLQDVPQAAWDLDTVFADDVLYLEWKARSKGRHVDDGVDTFIFHNGQIRVQTVKYTVQQD